MLSVHKPVHILPVPLRVCRIDMAVEPFWNFITALLGQQMVEHILIWPGNHDDWLQTGHHDGGERTLGDL